MPEARKTEIGVSKNVAPKLARFPNWDDVRIFGVVARSGSLRKASKWLRVQAPTISKHIESLEFALGLKLFDRTPQGLVLTAPGRRAARGADSMEMLMEETASRLHGAREIDGEVRLLMSDGPADRWFIPYFLTLFDQRHPRVSVRLCTSSETAETAVPEFDAQLQYAPAKSDGIMTVRIAKFHFIFFASKEYLENFGTPESQEDLADHRFADVTSTLHSENGLWSTYSNIESQGRASLISNSGLVVANAVQAGAVIGLLPSYIYLTTPNLIPILPSIHYEVGVYLNFSSAAAERYEVRAMLDFLKDTVFDKRMPWFSDTYNFPSEKWRGVLSQHLKMQHPLKK